MCGALSPVVCACFCPECTTAVWWLALYCDASLSLSIARCCVYYVSAQNIYSIDPTKTKTIIPHYFLVGSCRHRSPWPHGWFTHLPASVSPSPHGITPGSTADPCCEPHQGGGEPGSLQPSLAWPPQESQRPVPTGTKGILQVPSPAPLPSPCASCTTAGASHPGLVGGLARRGWACSRPARRRSCGSLRNVWGAARFGSSIATGHDSRGGPYAGLHCPGATGWWPAAATVADTASDATAWLTVQVDWAQLERDLAALDEQQSQLPQQPPQLQPQPQHPPPDRLGTDCRGSGELSQHAVAVGLFIMCIIIIIFWLEPKL